MFCEKQSFLRNEFHDKVLLPPYSILSEHIFGHTYPNKPHPNGWFDEPVCNRNRFGQNKQALNNCDVIRIGTLTGGPLCRESNPLCRIKNHTVVYMITSRLSFCKIGVYNVRLLIILDRGCSSLYRKKIISYEYLFVQSVCLSCVYFVYSVNFILQTLHVVSEIILNET